MDHDIAAILSEMIDPERVLRSNQVAALDPGVEETNTGAEVAVRPVNAQEVSAVLSACNRHGIGVVTHGGRTGLAEGAVSRPGEVILLTDRLEGGIEIEPSEQVASVSAAVTQQALQEAATEHGLSMGIDTASRGSATIGGMISTNAGGMEAFRNGMMRDRLLGIEAVLPDGTIVSDLTRVMKANEGYDLKQLFCGAEGTLGVVTRAILRLEPASPASNTVLLGVTGPDAALQVMRAVQSAGGLLLCELMWAPYAKIVASETGLSHVLGFCEAPCYQVIESALDEEALFETLAPFFEAGDVIDAVLAKSEKERADIWRIREDSFAAQRAIPNPLWYDVSVPLTRLGAYVDGVQARLGEIDPACTFYALAHLGDGNLHLTVAREDPFSDAEYMAVSQAIEAGVKEMGGAVSAEHGIGLAKLKTLWRCAPEGNLAAMRAIKQALDPNGVMNPGKVLPV